MAEVTISNSSSSILPVQSICMSIPRTRAPELSETPTSTARVRSARSKGGNPGPQFPTWPAGNQMCSNSKPREGPRAGTKTTRSTAPRKIYHNRKDFPRRYPIWRFRPWALSMKGSGREEMEMGGTIRKGIRPKTKSSLGTLGMGTKSKI